MAHRYFTTDITGDTARLTDADAHHLAVVLRAQAGDEITVCDGAGFDYACRVARADRDGVELEVLSKAPSASEPSVAVTLYVGYPKQDKLEHIIQKATELGAARIVPFFSRCCVAAPKNEEKKNARYARIALEAAKQSGRGRVPEVSMPMTFDEMLRDAAGCDAAFFCDEAGGAPLHSRLGGGAKSVAIVTGSEGGFLREEAQKAAGAGLVAIGLGPRILRCETAPLAALTVVMALTGNLQ